MDKDTWDAFARAWDADVQLARAEAALRGFQELVASDGIDPPLRDRHLATWPVAVRQDDSTAGGDVAPAGDSAGHAGVLGARVRSGCDRGGSDTDGDAADMIQTTQFNANDADQEEQ